MLASGIVLACMCSSPNHIKIERERGLPKSSLLCFSSQSCEVVWVIQNSLRGNSTKLSFADALVLIESCRLQEAIMVVKIYRCLHSS